MAHPTDPSLPSTLGATGDAFEALSVGASLSPDDDAPDVAWLQESPEARYSEDGAELGRGGIGRVYSAFDQQLGREVAIKVLLTDGVGSSQGTLSSVERRFVHEARITGQLEHPAIVPVHDLGVRPDGSLYYTMKRVRGRNLAEALGAADGLEGRLALLGHVLDMCQALAYAHSRGIVHRDLKPANVMVGPFGDTVVLDWGLAKHIGEKDPTDDLLGRELATLEQVQRGRTLVGTALGTPAYMSPEQARGDVDAIDARSDVWGLGAVLYEVLTGHAPYATEQVSALDQARAGAVRPVNERVPSAPPELVAVVDKALAPDPDDRYPDASALADELEAWMQGRRVRAFQYSTLDLTKRLVLRNKALSGVIAAALVGAAVGGVALFDAWQLAEARAIEAAASEQDAHESLSVAYAEKARDLLEADAPEEAAIFAAAAMVHAPDVPGGPWFDADRADPAHRARLEGLLADARARSRVEHVATLGPFGRRVRHMEASLDGRFVAIQRGGGNIDLLETATGRIAHRLPMQAQTVDGVAWLQDGTLIVPSSDAKTLLRVQPDGTVVASFPHDFQARGMRFVTLVAATPDGARVAAVGSGDIVVFDGATGQTVAVLPNAGTNGVAISTDGQRVVAYGHQSDATLYDLSDGTVLRRWGGAGKPLDAAFVGDRLLLATPDGLEVVDALLGTDRPERTTAATRGVSASPDGQTVLALEPNGAVLRDAATLETIAVLPRPEGVAAPLVQWAGDDHIVWVDPASGGRTLLFHHRAEAPARWVPPVFPRSLTAGADGRFVGIGDGSSAGLLDVGTGALQDRIDGLLGTHILPLREGAGLAISDGRLRLTLLDLGPEGPSVRATPAVRGPDQVDVQRAPGAGPGDGQAAVGPARVAFAQIGRPVRVHDSVTGDVIHTLPHSTDPQQIAFDADGQRIAVCAQAEVATHPSDGGPSTSTPWALPAPCASVAWAPSGEALVAADATGTVHTLSGDGSLAAIARFEPPLTLSWTNAGIIVDAGPELHVIEADGTPLRSVPRHQPGAHQTHVKGDGAEAIWFGDGASIRHLDLVPLPALSPQQQLAEAERASGLQLEGFRLRLPPAPPVPAPDDPRAIRGQTATTDRGWISFGEAQLLDRQTLEPVGARVPIQHDGSFTLVPPPDHDGELAVQMFAEGYQPAIVLSPQQRPGGEAWVSMVTLGGLRLVHALAGIPMSADRPGISVIVQHVDEGRPRTPVGCAEVLSDPPHPVIYTEGNGDSRMSSRTSTHPFDGRAALFAATTEPRRLTVRVGGQEQVVDIPAQPTGTSTFVLATFPGPNPTPDDCR